MRNTMRSTIDKDVDEDRYRVKSMNKEVKKFCHVSFQQAPGNNNYKQTKVNISEFL